MIVKQWKEVQLLYFYYGKTKSDPCFHSNKVQRSVIKELFSDSSPEGTYKDVLWKIIIVRFNSCIWYGRRLMLLLLSSGNCCKLISVIIMLEGRWI